jgi:hypothetical protein
MGEKKVLKKHKTHIIPKSFKFLININNIYHIIIKLNIKTQTLKDRLTIYDLQKGCLLKSKQNI